MASDIPFQKDLRAQTVSFGAVTGVHLNDDFRTGDLSARGFLYGDRDFGAGVTRTLTRSVIDESQRLLVGPRLEISFSDSFSVEVEALYRETLPNQVEGMIGVSF